MKLLKVPKFLKSVRYLLAVVNALFLLTGILLLLLGIVILVKFNSYEALITQRFFNVAGFVISTGIIICVAAILGFFAAISENFYAIASYVILSIVVLIFEVAMIVVGFGLRNDATSEIRSAMAQSLQLYSTRIEVARMWDELQKNFECCGVAGRNDWGATLIPVSCCHIDYGTISPFECGLANSYTNGCATELGAWLGELAYAVAIAACVVASIQFVLTALAGYLGWKSKYEEVELES